tara:strand:+ start:228 stop:956 length:729 start_codon:yes stop_codon:yes gene_type:complete
MAAPLVAAGVAAAVKTAAKYYAKKLATKTPRGAAKADIKKAAIKDGKTPTQADNIANYAMRKEDGLPTALRKTTTNQSKGNSSFVKKDSPNSMNSLALENKSTTTGRAVSMKKPSDATSTMRSSSSRQSRLTGGENKVSDAIKKEAMKDVKKAGIAGAVVTAAVAAPKSNGDKKGATAQGRRGGVAPSSPMPTGGRVNKEDYPTYKKGTESAAAFRKQFKDAKDSGKKTFTYEGRKYNTQDK